MASSARLLSLLVLSTHTRGAMARAFAEAEEANDAKAAELEAAMPSAGEAEQHLLGFASLWRRHEHDASKVFAEYNRFHDTKKSGGEQALGNQELRALLKDIGIGNLVLRGAMVELLLAFVDSNGDSRVSESELRAAFDLLGCWLGDADPSTDADTVLAPARRLGATVASLIRRPHVDGLVSALIEAELHSCAPAITAWWGSGWAAHLVRLEEQVQSGFDELAHSNRYVCAARLPDRLLSHSTHPHGSAGGPRAGQLAVRTALKRAGMDSLLARHVLARAIVHTLDKDGDGLLFGRELAEEAMLLCDLYAAVSARGTRLVAVARALSLPLPDGYPPKTFLNELSSSHAESSSVAITPTTLDAARAAASANVLSAPAAVAILEAYIRLAPLEAIGGKSKDEL